ncbi:unnamed protein product [Sphagnum balticum]
MPSCGACQPTLSQEDKMKETKPYDIIDAFDACLTYVYGKKYAREYPAKHDSKNAEEWIKKGLTLPVACFVFYHQMSRMHERWLRRPESDRYEIPVGISVFDENLEAAIRRASGVELDEAEKSEALWRNRFRGWLKGYPWYENMWGSPPLTEDGSISKKCRIPMHIIEEILVVGTLLDNLGPVRDAIGQERCA